MGYLPLPGMLSTGHSDDQRQSEAMPKAHVSHEASLIFVGTHVTLTFMFQHMAQPWSILLFIHDSAFVSMDAPS